MTCGVDMVEDLLFFLLCFTLSTLIWDMDTAVDNDDDLAALDSPVVVLPAVFTDVGFGFDEDILPNPSLQLDLLFLVVLVGGASGWDNFLLLLLPLVVVVLAAFAGVGLDVDTAAAEDAVVKPLPRSPVRPTPGLLIILLREFVWTELLLREEVELAVDDAVPLFGFDCVVLAAADGLRLRVRVVRGAFASVSVMFFFSSGVFLCLYVHFMMNQL